MSEPSIQDAKEKFEKHCKFLLEQAIQTFEENNKVFVSEISLTRERMKPLNNITWTILNFNTEIESL